MKKHMTHKEKEHFKELARLVDRKGSTIQTIVEALNTLNDYDQFEVRLNPAIYQMRPSDLNWRIIGSEESQIRQEGKRVANNVRSWLRRQAKLERLDTVRRKAVRALNTHGRDGLVRLFRQHGGDVGLTYFDITEWMRGESRLLDGCAEHALRSIQL